MIGAIGGFTPYNYISPYQQKAEEERKESLGIKDPIKEAKDEAIKKNDPLEKADPEEKAKKRSGAEECETCENRKYQDGSDENVSFKAASHISPEAAGAAVRAHEGEHVANAYDKAKQAGGEVVQASVSIHTSICPECGRTYVSGGTTHTQIKYPNESNPYQQQRKAEDAARYTGTAVNLAG